MGFCTRRHLFLTVCALQMLTVVERQIFDFLGFLWVPILVNFFGLIFIIFGFFGAYQYRPKYIITYLLWHLFWIAWNVFLVCLFLNVAGLDHETNKVLKLDPTSDSWWKVSGPGCKIVDVDQIPQEYTGCLVNYVYVEIFHSGLQCFLALFSSIIGICLSRTFLEEDDTSSLKSTRKSSKQQRMSLYSIEFSQHGDSDNEYDQNPSSPKPMTPRRVKRRSVMQRGTSGRHSTHSTNSRRQNQSRSSTRSSRRTTQNPVTRLLEQQQKCQAYESNTSMSPVESPLPNYYSNSPTQMNPQYYSNTGHTNPSYQQSTTSLNQDIEELYNNRPASVRSSYSNFHGARANYSPPKQYHHSHATPQVPQKRGNPGRSSMRHMTFMNNGPPAYTMQSGMPLDSETPM